MEIISACFGRYTNLSFIMDVDLGWEKQEQMEVEAVTLPIPSFVTFFLQGIACRAVIQKVSLCLAQPCQSGALQLCCVGTSWNFWLGILGNCSHHNSRLLSCERMRILDGLLPLLVTPNCAKAWCGLRLVHPLLHPTCVGRIPLFIASLSVITHKRGNWSVISN